ncbi:MAG: histidine kinase [Prolixibacteraceae bacterium]|nr:histidine kinase [Prolixibacteraceae bacterium]
MKAKTISILFQIAIWIVYIFLPVFVVPQPSSIFQNNTYYLILYIVVSIFSIGYFYFNYNYVIPKYYFTKKFFLTVLANFIYLLLTVGVLKVTDTIYEYSLYEEGLQRPVFFSGFFIRFIVLFAIAFGLRINKHLKLIEAQKKEAELIALKARLNPHFLFNVLNDIYGQALIKSDTTHESIAKLSSLMRYVITECNVERVAFERELSYMKNYIELQRLRLTPKTKVNLKIEGTTENIWIQPLLFIPFIENAFKYGVSTEKPSSIDIDFVIKNNCINFSVRNKIVISPDNYHESNNIGIETSVKRLNNLFNNQYKLDIVEKEKEFLLTLKINLNA